MERIGIYGGAFNPPHLGHIRGAQYALEALHLTKLLMIPSCVSPHKERPAFGEEPEQCLELLKLSVEGLDGIEISDMELRRGGVSYTWQTVEQVRSMYPGAQLVLFMGTDMFLTFETWKCTDKLIKYCDLAVFYRGDPDEIRQIQEQKIHLETMGARVHVLKNPITEISSTQLRRMLVFQCARPFMAPAAYEYVQKHGLYGTGRDYKNLPMQQLEPIAVSLHKPNRVRHILGVRDTAKKLAKLYGADPVDAERAGLLHDITKALDGPLQLTLCAEYGKVLDIFSSRNPKTLHALTGSLVAERIFGENQAVVEAIRSHTTGKANMNLLQKIVYVADYMEPNRNFPGVEKLRDLAFQDIDQALELGLHMTLDHLKKQGKEVSPESQEALEYLVSTRKG